MRKKWKQLMVCLAIPLAVGDLSAFLSRQGMKDFGALRQPPLSPPMWLFPVVWTALFLMMGLASWLVLREERKPRDGALTVYGVQLFFNFFWSLLFFRWGTVFPGASVAGGAVGTDPVGRASVPQDQSRRRVADGPVSAVGQLRRLSERGHLAAELSVEPMTADGLPIGAVGVDPRAL